MKAVMSMFAEAGWQPALEKDTYSGPSYPAVGGKRHTSGPIALPYLVSNCLDVLDSDRSLSASTVSPLPPVFLRVVFSNLT